MSSRNAVSWRFSAFAALISALFLPEMRACDVTADTHAVANRYVCT
jgi:hypothetical protein